MNVILFEDRSAARLAPLTLGRPAFTITCGGWHLLQLVMQWASPLQAIVRPHLQETISDHLTSFTSLDPSQPTLLLNACVVPDSRALAQLYRCCQSEASFRVDDQATLLAAYLPSQANIQLHSIHYETVAEIVGQIELTRIAHVEFGLEAFGHPFDIIPQHERVMLANLEHRLQGDEYRETAPGVFVAGSTQPPPHVAWDTQDGPILLEDHVELGPFSFFRGPIHIGPSSKISPHAFLKGPIALGHTTKVGGEVGSSIIEAFSNKAHFGYLGHSYVGRWVNLGAGTTNSNLKNTYGSVRVECGGEKIDTQRQFLGCVIGDYTKTAVNTGIFTGKVLGACSNVYGLVTTNVPSFANYARILGDVTAFPPEIMETTQRRVFARRGLTQRPCDVALLRQMFALTRAEGELANEPPKL